MFEGGHAKSQELAGEIRKMTEECGCGFLDAAAVLSCSEIDGVHFEAAGHAALGRAVAHGLRGLSL
jgi:lysophospholipase L1-like esterase